MRLGRFGACEANFLSGGGLRLHRSLFNWLRYVDGVASLDINDRSTRALGHGTLGVRWNHPVRLVLLAGWLIAPLMAPMPHGTWESAMNAAFSGSTSAAKEAGKLRLVELATNI